MKKTLLIILLPIFLFNCSKSDDSINYESEIIGTYKISKQVYRYEDGPEEIEVTDCISNVILSYNFQITEFTENNEIRYTAISCHNNSQSLIRVSEYSIEGDEITIRRPFEGSMTTNVFKIVKLTNNELILDDIEVYGHYLEYLRID